MAEKARTARAQIVTLKDSVTSVQDERRNLVSNFLSVVDKCRQRMKELSSQIMSLNSQINEMEAQSKGLAQSINAGVGVVASQMLGQAEVLLNCAEEKKRIQNSALEADTAILDELTNLDRSLESTEDTLGLKQRLYFYIIANCEDLSKADSWFATQMMVGGLRGFNRELDDALYTTPDGQDGLPLIQYDISASDIDQNYAGDCWIMAIVASIADRDPEHFKSMIRILGQNEYQVSLFDKNGQKIYVNVDQSDIDRFIEANGDSAGRSNEEWVSVIEAAVSKTPSIYRNPNRRDQPLPNLYGGSPKEQVEMYRALTGRTSTQIQGSADVKSKDLTHYTSFSEAEFTKRVNSGGVVWASTPADPDLIGPAGFEENHVFSVIKVFELDGKQMVTMRNPWAGGEGTTDGYFSVSMSDFRKFWPDIYAGN